MQGHAKKNQTVDAHTKSVKLCAEVKHEKQKLAQDEARAL